MQRRNFLTGVAASVWLTKVQAEQKRKPTLGYSLYGMRTVPTAQAIKECAAAGYQDLELCFLPDWPMDPKTFLQPARKELFKRLQDAHLNVPAVMENLPLVGDDKTFANHTERFKRALDFCQDLQEQHPPVIETILGGKVGDWDELKNQFRDRLGIWLNLCKSTKHTVAIKPHRLNAMNRPEHITWLLQQLQQPALQVCYDWSHFEQRDMQLTGTLDLLLPQTAFIHVKDTRVQDNKIEFLLPGDGQTDYKVYFSELQKRNYNQSICVEVSSMIHSKKEYDPIAAMKRSYQTLRKAYEQVYMLS